MMIGIANTVAAVSSQGKPSPALPTLLTNLAVWYRNNGTDRSGNGVNLSASGSGPSIPGTAAGIDGTAGAAASFNGDIDSFWFINSRIMVAAPCSFHLWFRPDGTSNSRGLWGQSFSDHQFMGIDGTSVLTCKLRTTGAGTVGAYVPGAWNHAVVTNNGATSKLYVGGVLVATAAEVPDFAFPNNQGFSYGADSANNFNGSITGRIQNFAAWTRVLTASEVARLYNKGTGFDPTV